MTDANEESRAQGEALAQHIKAALKDHPNATVRVNPTIQAPIPERIAKNILEFLQRVQSTGMEAVAWVEAYQYVQQHVPQPQPQPPPPPQGVPFAGLPTK
jgi:alkylated DNA repair dioxygenase AlkB